MENNINKDIPVTKVEKLSSSPEVEFPPLTEKDLEEIRILNEKLQKVFEWKGARGFTKYTGIGVDVGSDDIYLYYNSKVTARQLLSAIALTRNPILEQMIKPRFNYKEFDARILVENKIMAGMKILDLGCGPKPVFARCCRAMGADVWTVDQIPVSDLEFESKFFTQT